MSPCTQFHVSVAIIVFFLPLDLPVALVKHNCVLAEIVFIWCVAYLATSALGLD